MNYDRKQQDGLVGVQFGEAERNCKQEPCEGKYFVWEYGSLWTGAAKRNTGGRCVDIMGQVKKTGMNTFTTYHPVVNFAYFAAVILFSMFLMHPVCLAVSLVCSFLYAVMLNGRQAVRFNLLCLLPLMLFSALLNPLFNHEGMTILVYLPSGNPLTLESILYGLAAAAMLVTVIGWFSCYNAVMTSDKFLYLFGRIIPSLSLILSMALRFVPKFKAQIKVIANAQRCIGRDSSNGSLLSRAKQGLTILSVMVTWALENAVETADSMKSRGYGLPGRTTFSVFTFDGRDKAVLSGILCLAGYVLLGRFLGGLSFQYFPSMDIEAVTPYHISLFTAYFLLCIMPVILQVWEDHKWNTIESNI